MVSGREGTTGISRRGPTRLTWRPNPRSTICPAAGTRCAGKGDFAGRRHGPRRNRQMRPPAGPSIAASTHEPEAYCCKVMVKGEGDADSDIRVAALDLVVGVPNFRFKDVVSPLTLERVMRQALQETAPTLMAQAGSKNSISRLPGRRGGGTARLRRRALRGWSRYRPGRPGCAPPGARGRSPAR